jgi:hypothetical protein
MDLVQSCLRRNRELNVRKPKPTTVSMILAFNETEATLSYENLMDIFYMYMFGPHHIVDVDESRFSNVWDTPPVIIPKDQRNVEVAIVFEKGRNVLFHELQWTICIIHIHFLPFGNDTSVLKIRMEGGQFDCHVAQTFLVQYSDLHSEPHTSNHGQPFQSHIILKSRFLQGKWRHCGIYSSSSILQMQPLVVLFVGRCKSVS